MIVEPIKTRIFQEGEDLIAFIVEHLPVVKSKAIVVVTSKIIALSERRTAVVKNIQEKIKIIRQESDFAVPTKYVWLTIKDGMVMASAGIDESNAKGKLILLPRDSFRSAGLIRRMLKKKYGLKQLGVIVTDSRTIPLRAGVMGVALGYAGFRGVRDYRGTPDIFGRKFKFSRTDVVDSLAASAVVVMGEGDERRPLALIEDIQVDFCDRINRQELHIDIQDDMYRPLFTQLPRRYRTKKSNK